MNYNYDDTITMMIVAKITTTITIMKHTIYGNSRKCNNNTFRGRQWMVSTEKQI